MAVGNTPLCSLAHKAVIRELEQAPDEIADAIRECVHEAAREDHPGAHPNVKRMGGQHEAFYRIRVGDYRAILDKHMGHVRLLLVKPRQTAYREDNLAKARVRSQQR